MDFIYIGSASDDAQKKFSLNLAKANRHGLISGATGTGKTVTLQVLAEGFSAAGVPVFITDVKGDLTGISQPSKMQDFLVKRATEIDLNPYTANAYPAIFWDLFGVKGHPVRTTISEMGPLLLSRLMELNEVQQGVLDVAFCLADKEGLLLLDLKDLRALLSYMNDNAADISKEYGNVTASSISSIQRGLLRLDEQGADTFFGEPALDLRDLMRVSYDGRGFVSVLESDKLLLSPRLYATFLLWLLSELFEDLPEVGDLPKPKLVLFFDEAHLLFKDMPKALLEKIEQVVRLVRSKGVGVYFITQNPSDIPDSVLGQLGNKIQHALRAFTPSQKKDIQSVVDGFRPNPRLNIEEIVQTLKVGEALVSCLNDKGEPEIVERVLIRPPSSSLGAVDAMVLQTFLQNSPVAQQYAQSLDRQSAYEGLMQRAVQVQKDKESVDESAEKRSPWGDAMPARTGKSPQGIGETLLKSVVRAVGSSVGRQIAREVMRGILGSMTRR